MAVSSEQYQQEQQQPRLSKPGDPNANIAQAIQDISERAQVLVREEIELAKAEVTAKVSSLVRGVVIGVAAGVFAIFGLSLLLQGFAWLAYWAIPAFPTDAFFWGFFLVAGVLFLFGALAGFLASRAFKKGAPPTPELAIDEAKLIKETVTSDHPQRTV
jgi:Putative Actinobacterial Holin-X, holin superfamily III